MLIPTPTLWGIGVPRSFVMSITKLYFFLWTFYLFCGNLCETKGVAVSNYEDGFADGIRHIKDELLEWADTYEDYDPELLVQFYHKLIEKLEQ